MTDMQIILSLPSASDRPAQDLYLTLTVFGECSVLPGSVRLTSVVSWFGAFGFEATSANDGDEIAGGEWAWSRHREYIETKVRQGVELSPAS